MIFESLPIISLKGNYFELLSAMKENDLSDTSGTMCNVDETILALYNRYVHFLLEKRAKYFVIMMSGGKGEAVSCITNDEVVFL